MASSSTDELTTAILAVVQPVLDEHQVELVELVAKGSHGSRVVRIVADADGGLDIDVIAAVSRALGDPLDEVVDGAWTLEVTSPGADRPLKTARDFARNTGREVHVQRTSDAAAAHGGEVTGTVDRVTDDVVVLDVDGDEVRVPVADVEFGRVVLPW